MGNTLGAATPSSVSERLSEAETEDLWALFERLATTNSAGPQALDAHRDAKTGEYTRRKGRTLRVRKAVFMESVLPDFPAISSQLFDTFAVSETDEKHGGKHNENVSSQTAEAELDWAHFAVGMVLVTRGSLKEKLKFLFRLFDFGHDGELSRREMQGMLSSSIFAGTRLRAGCVNDAEDGNGQVGETDMLGSQGLALGRRIYLRAKWDYNARKGDELSFKTGDVIMLMRKYDANWWLGNLRGQNGYIPSNYVTVAPGNTATSATIEVGSVQRPVTLLARHLTDDAFAKAQVTGTGGMTEKEFVKWAQSSYPLKLLLNQLKELDLSPPKMEITGPTGFRKGKGFTEQGGLNLAELEPSLRALLEGSGYTQEILEDKGTADMVLDILTEKMESAPPPPLPSKDSAGASGSAGQGRPALPSRPSRRAPRPPAPTKPLPPPPTATKEEIDDVIVVPNRPAPAVPDYDAPAPPDAQSAVSKAASDTGSSAGSGPPPPPPPPPPALPKLVKKQPAPESKPSPANLPAPQVDLMQSIRDGMQLKHAEVDEEDSKENIPRQTNALFAQIENFQKRTEMRHVDLEEIRIDRLSEKKTQGLMGTLNRALQSRRQFLKESVEASVDHDLFPDNDDEW